jgi:ribonuclease HII
MMRYGVKKFEAQHKADENYPIVAAASICAKLLRDRKIAEIKSAIGDFGSGYPSDARTISALRNKEMAQKLKPFVRKKWKTLDRIKQRKLFED